MFKSVKPTKKIQKGAIHHKSCSILWCFFKSRMGPMSSLKNEKMVLISSEGFQLLPGAVCAWSAVLWRFSSSGCKHHFQRSLQMWKISHAALSIASTAGKVSHRTAIWQFRPIAVIATPHLTQQRQPIWLPRVLHSPQEVKGRNIFPCTKSRGFFRGSIEYQSI